MTYFAPIQPLLGVVSLVLLGYALWGRLRALVPARPPLPVEGA